MTPVSKSASPLAGGVAGLLLCLVPWLVLAATPTLSVKASRDRIFLGEAFLLEVKVDGVDNPEAPDLSAIRNCSVELLGSQSSSHFTVVIVNGQMRREGFSGRIFTYKMTPKEEGTLTAGPVTARVNGSVVSAKGPAITITGVTQQDLVLASVAASRSTVLVDEPFEIQLTVRVRCLPEPYQDTEPLFPADPPHLEAAFLNGQEIDGLKGPDFQRLLGGRLIRPQAPGFTLNEYASQGDPFDFGQMFNMQGRPARFKLDGRKVILDGRHYWEYTLAVPYTPVTEGAYTFGPLLFKGSVPLEVKADGTANVRPVFTVGPAATVRVIPPPEENRPDSYIGAIGSNLTVEVALDAQTCNVGDPLKLTLSLSGAIQMRNITPPKLTLQSSLVERFEIYDDSVKALKQNGQRQYEYTLRPRQAGSFELPPVEVSFYDVTRRQYETVRSRPIPLKVRQAAEITASQIIGGSTNAGPLLKQEMEMAMRPAGIRMGAAGAESGSLIGDPRKVALTAGTGPVLFMVCLAGLWIRRNSPAFRRARRQQQALARARNALAGMAGKGAAGPDHKAVCVVMRHYLAERFDLQAESLTPVEAESLLIAQGMPCDLAKRFAGIMQRHFEATFGSGSAPVVTGDVLEVLSAVESYRNERPRSRLARRVPWVLLLALGAVGAKGSTTAERSFIWLESLTGMSSAQTPKEFLAVAETCQKLVDLGVRNADLFYNQGTALLLADKPADAVAVLMRAERYGGGAADLSRNLAIAEGRKQGAKVPVTPWSRWVLFWHYGLDGSTRAMATAVAFSGLWIAGALGVLGFRRLSKFLLVAGAVTFILAGSSLLTTIQQENQISRPASLP